LYVGATLTVQLVFGRRAARICNVSGDRQNHGQNWNKETNKDIGMRAWRIFKYALNWFVLSWLNLLIWACYQFWYFWTRCTRV